MNNNHNASRQHIGPHGTPARCTLQFVRRCYGLCGIYGWFDSKIWFEIESDGQFDSIRTQKNDSQLPSGNGVVSSSPCQSLIETYLNQQQYYSQKQSYLASCMLNSNDGIILSICTGFQMLHCKSSVTVLRTTPWSPCKPASRSLKTIHITHL